MRFFLLLGALVCVCAFGAEAPADPALLRARAEVERIRVLVDAGAAARAQLEVAEKALADAEDAALLRRTLYGEDLTEDQIEPMIAAAGRRLERRKQELERARTLVSEGVSAETAIETATEDVARVRQEYELALSRAKLVRALAEMVRREQQVEEELERSPMVPPDAAERYDGDGLFLSSHFRRIEAAFQIRFSRPLPVSAYGETAVHRSLGFDHRDRVDVAIHPDTPEGVWLRHFLTENHIPYCAFRQAVPGKATAAHIHIGPMSTRLASGS